MSVPTLRSLSDTLGEHLHPLGTDPLPETPIDAVHINDQAEPTAYLSGGELLLTTGLSVVPTPAGCLAYVGRLRDAGVAAVGFGLGPVYDEVPAPFVEACTAVGMPLLVVPERTPFVTISRAYWSAVARSGEQDLLDQLAGQRALVDAASSSDPTRAILQTLAKWLDGWAAALSPAGELIGAQPSESPVEMTELRSEIARLSRTGHPASASVEVAGRRRLTILPLDTAGGSGGYLAVVSRSRLDPGTRRTVLAAAALLGLVSARRDAESIARSIARETVARTVARLLADGHPDAARDLAAASLGAPLTARVRVVAVRSPVRPARLVGLLGGAERAVHEAVAEDRTWLVTPPTSPPMRALAEAIRGEDPATAAVISPPVRLEDVAETRLSALDRLEALPPGTVVMPSMSESAVTAALETLLAPEQDRLVSALTAFLRHHGHWESAARAEGLHRNSLRHRVRQAGNLLGLDLDDPDVRAHLWLALSTVGRRP